MQVPQNQQELILLLKEQDKKIADMRKVIMQLEYKLKQTVLLVERTRLATVKQADMTNTIMRYLKEHNSGYK